MRSKISCASASPSYGSPPPPSTTPRIGCCMRPSVESGRVIASRRETSPAATVSRRGRDCSPAIGPTASRPDADFPAVCGLYPVWGRAAFRASVVAVLCLLALPPLAGAREFRSSARDVECRSEGGGVLCAANGPFPGARPGTAGGNCRSTERVGSVKLTVGDARVRNVCGPITARPRATPTGFLVRVGPIGCIALSKTALRCRSRATGYEFTVTGHGFSRRRESQSRKVAENRSEDQLLAEQQEHAGGSIPPKEPTPGARECGIALGALCE